MQKQVFKQEDWNLRDLLKAHKGKEFDLYLKNLDKDVKKFESYRKELKNNISPEKLLEIIKHGEDIECQVSKISSYAHLKFSVDTKSQEARSFKDRMQNYFADIDNKILFFQLWFKNLDNKNADKLIRSSGKYKYYFEKLRLTKDYVLSEHEEKIINLKDATGADALNSLYNIITSSFKYEFKVNNEVKILNQSQIVSYATHPDKELREQAYKIILETYQKNKDVLGDIYKSRATDWKNTFLKLRNYSSPISPRNLGNNISDKAVKTMLDICKKNTKVFHRYFKLKARLMNVKKIHRYHVYAPLLEKQRQHEYRDAINLILECYNSFSPKMAELALKIINEKHIHSKLSDSKVGGAYCYDIMPGVTPYVFVNFDGKDKDVTTIAHELGHGVHDLLTHNNPPLLSHPPLILAETASIFSEMIVTDKLLRDERDYKIRQVLIASKIEDLCASIMRQSFFVLFELEAHEAIYRGATIDELSEIYLKSLKEQFGDSVEVSDDFKSEWLRIPHIYHTPFYCYAYSFGNLLVLALYQMYKKEGKSFVPKYLKFLSYGGSKKPSEICRELNIDLESKKFWQQGFDLINEMITELEKNSN